MPQSLFTDQTPVSGDNSDGTPGITTSTAQRYGVPGRVTGIRFWATSTVGGVYSVALWEVTAADPNGSGGTKLEGKTLVAPPSPDGWNVVDLDDPVVIDTAKLYKPSLFSGDGRYVFTSGLMASPITNEDITAPAHGADPVGLGNLNQGSFTINAAESYPTSQPGSSCYFIDSVFVPDSEEETNDLASAITLPALQATAALTAQSALSGPVSLPALQAAAALTAQSALASAMSLPAMSMAGVLSMSNALASALSLPALDMVAVLDIPAPPVEDTSSPNAPISTSSRPLVIATVSREFVISTGTQGGM